MTEYRKTTNCSVILPFCIISKNCLLTGSRSPRMFNTVLAYAATVKIQEENSDFASKKKIQTGSLKLLKYVPVFFCP